MMAVKCVAPTPIHPTPPFSPADASFVMTTVAEEDPSRPPWPSSPSPGWTSGVDRLTALPNGRALSPMSVAAGESLSRAELERATVALASEATRASAGN